MFYPEMTPQAIFFELFDLNGDSIIDPLEFKQVHIEMDTDSNNKITLEEFIAWLGDDKIRLCSCCQVPDFLDMSSRRENGIEPEPEVVTL